MSAFRRVVTGHNASGLSVIASDELVSGVALPGMPSIELNRLWGADTVMRFPDAGTSPLYKDWFAPIGGFRIAEFTIGPESDAAPSHDDADAARQLAQEFPGLLEVMDPEVPGMHRSTTIDFIYILSGRIELELDDGSKTELKAGDLVIQSATKHAWHNHWNEPCRMLGVILGAHYEPHT